MKSLFKSASLTPAEKKVILCKGTEMPNSGIYNLTDTLGTYLCRQCGLALFRSTDKFISSCGWPSFDDEIEGAIHRDTDRDGKRTEILCQRCHGHLGHVFQGEKLTSKDQRHCVNSLAIDFVENITLTEAQEAVFAGGCFWGVQTLLNQNKGVVKSEVGYCGGITENPSYEQICTGRTGHLEVIRVLFDPKVIDYKTLTKDFFSIHNPTQVDGQGPDIGGQYQSAIFCYDEIQKNTAEMLISELEKKGLNVATKILDMSVFWPAENYHQDYYLKNGNAPYCHMRVNRFND